MSNNTNTRRLTVRLTRRGSTRTRTNTSLAKVEVEKQQPRQEQYNMNALVVKNLGYDDPSKGKTQVYYSYIEINISNLKIKKII